MICNIDAVSTLSDLWSFCSYNWPNEALNMGRVCKVHATVNSLVTDNIENLVINPFMPNGLFYLNSLDRFIFFIGGVWFIFVGISELNANNVDPDQMPCSVASDLGLHCLPMSLLGDARLKLVKYSAILVI